MQTSYTDGPAVAFAGKPEHMGPKHDDSVRCAVASIGFGLAVARGTGDNDGKLPTASGDEILGVALHEHIEQNASGVAAHAEKSVFPVRKLGRVWVRVEQAVSPSDSVFVRFNDATEGTKLGAFRKDVNDVGGARAVAWTKAKFLTTAAEGGLVLLSINNL